MHRFAIWVCCLVLVGCEVETAPTPSPKYTVIQHEGYTEFKLEQIVSNVRLVPGAIPVTFALMTDDSDKSYVTRTEHDCKARVSTLKYLAVYDSEKQLISEDEVEIDLEIKAGSLGEAELQMACNNPTEGI